MGIYRHYTEQQLTQMRDSLMTSLHQRLTGPTSASTGSRSVQFQQKTEEIRKELGLITEELDARAGVASHRPIYLV